MCALASAARRELRLFAPQLAAGVFAGAAVTDALARFVTQHPRTRLRLLIEDDAQVRRDHERLLELARRTADQCELRVVDEADRGARELYLVADRKSALVQDDLAHDEGRLREPLEAIRLAQRFDAAWERAQALPLRALGLGA